MGAEYSGLGSTNVPVKWSQGSAGIMQRTEITKSGITVSVFVFFFNFLCVMG